MSNGATRAPQDGQREGGETIDSSPGQPVDDDVQKAPDDEAQDAGDARARPECGASASMRHAGSARRGSARPACQSRSMRRSGGAGDRRPGVEGERAVTEDDRCVPAGSATARNQPSARRIGSRRPSVLRDPARIVQVRDDEKTRDSSSSARRRRSSGRSSARRATRSGAASRSGARRVRVGPAVEEDLAREVDLAGGDPLPRSRGVRLDPVAPHEREPGPVRAEGRAVEVADLPRRRGSREETASRAPGRWPRPPAAPYPPRSKDACIAAEAAVGSGAAVRTVGIAAGQVRVAEDAPRAAARAWRRRRLRPARPRPRAAPSPA